MKPRLTPELLCKDFDQSLKFYTKVLGFNVLYARPEDLFAMLEYQGAQLMIEGSHNDRWLTGGLERPFGRGINFQIQSDDVNALYKKLKDSDVNFFNPMEEKWYRSNDIYLGNRQFLIQDPDGYLLRFFQDLGQRNKAPA